MDIGSATRRLVGLGPRLVQRGAPAVPAGARAAPAGAPAGSAPGKPLGLALGRLALGRLASVMVHSNGTAMVYI